MLCHSNRCINHLQSTCVIPHTVWLLQDICRKLNPYWLLYPWRLLKWWHFQFSGLPPPNNSSQMFLWISFCKAHVHWAYNNRWSFMLNWLFFLVDQTGKSGYMEICWNSDFFLQFYRYYMLSFIDYVRFPVSGICWLHMEEIFLFKKCQCMIECRCISEIKKNNMYTCVYDY